LTDHVLLSRSGSDRATAYNFSNKILRHKEQLLVTWLEAPDRLKAPTRIQLGVCDPGSGELLQTLTMGEGIDNHCGASLLTDADERVHMFIGAHHGDFLHRWSDDPRDPASWSAGEAIGPSHSYPAVAIDAQGTLHLVYRESYRGPGETWQMEYVSKRRGEDWSEPMVLAKCPVPGYSHFMHSLSLGPHAGSLHVTLQFHYAASGSAKQGRTKMAAHMRSDDGGAHWTSEGQACQLPMTIENARPFASCIEDEAATIRIGTHVVDAQEQPWVYCASPEAPYGIMWRRTVDGWRAIDLDTALPQLNFSGGGHSTATSRAADGRVHLLISTQAQGAGEGWYHVANEVHHVAFTPDGRIDSHQQLTSDDPTQARWLPSIEYWNWGAADSSCADGHWYLYTSGINAGWMDADGYQDTLKTQVWLGRL
jgi:hypothetical protein